MPGSERRRGAGAQGGGGAHGARAKLSAAGLFTLARDRDPFAVWQCPCPYASQLVSSRFPSCRSQPRSLNCLSSRPACLACVRWQI